MEKVSVMGSELIEINNFLSKRDCDDIIDFYTKNEKHAAYQYLSYFVMETTPGSIGDAIELECKKYDKNIALDLCQVVRWPPGSFMLEHKDLDKDRFAAVVYLNDDYTGGETCFEHTKVTPETGKLVIFSGNELPHWVSEIKDSNRYTLSIWFRENH